MELHEKIHYGLLFVGLVLYVFDAIVLTVRIVREHEIVQCKNCKWCSKITDEEANETYTWCGAWANETKPNTFCSYGQLKDKP